MPFSDIFPEWVIIAVMTLVAGLSMPLGAWIARFEHIRPAWLENEVRHGIIAFGGGALLSAVALVLVPEGIAKLDIPVAALCFAAGGLAFCGLDIYLAKKQTQAGQLAAMLTDFIPEALALGAAFLKEPGVAMLLATLIALQNLPEGFNSYREMMNDSEKGGRRLIAIFCGMALLGPAAGLSGHFFLRDMESLVSGIELIAAGGILYLVIQDIAPQAKLENHWLPNLGAVAGFLLGMIGHMMVA
jgi:ZIP family zinc transporter